MSFKTEDEENKDSNNNEDNFGLPDLDYKPLENLEESSTSSQATQLESPLMEEFSSSSVASETYQEEKSNYMPDEEPKSKAPIIISILIGLVVLVAGFLVWKYVIQPSNLKAQQEKIAKENERKAQEAAAKLAKQREEEERQRIAAEAAANAKPAIGVIETLTGPTGRYYVIIASAVDGDLIMDFSKKLSEKGVGSKIIPPFGKWKFTRLAISDHDTFAIAQSAADALKGGEHGETVWVMRY